MIEPQLNGRDTKPELTLAEFVDLYLDRHAVGVAHPDDRIATRNGSPTRPATTATCRSASSNGWATSSPAGRRRLPARSRYGIVGALRQTLGAAVRWGYMGANPAKLMRAEPGSRRRGRSAPTRSPSSTRSPPSSRTTYRPLPAFAAATGLRPEEWAALERRDVDRRGAIVNVRRTVSDGEVVELGKTSTQPPPGAALPSCARSARRAASPARHAAAVPAPRGGLLNLTTSAAASGARRSRPSGVAKPARIYDLRSTFASNALAAGVTVFELARVMGTSVAMIERHYGALLDGAHAGIAGTAGRARGAARAGGRGGMTVTTVGPFISRNAELYGRCVDASFWYVACSTCGAIVRVACKDRDAVQPHGRLTPLDLHCCTCRTRGDHTSCHGCGRCLPRWVPTGPLASSRRSAPRQVLLLKRLSSAGLPAPPQRLGPTFRALVGHEADHATLDRLRWKPRLCGDFRRRARQDSNLRPAD